MEAMTMAIAMSAMAMEAMTMAMAIDFVKHKIKSYLLKV
jgi:hypothetical protein